MTGIQTATLASVDEIAAAYASRRPRSRALYERLRALLPGGETRSVTFYRPFPSAIQKGEGAHILDADGHRYIDVLNNYTALVHGHAFPPAVEALQRVARDGTAFPAPTEALADLAEQIVQRFAAAELVRFTNSGTEAAILALRIARRASGRRKIVMFNGGYHGTAPPFADGDLDAVLVPYNDLDAVEEAVSSEVAAVFAEPFLGSGGVIPAAPGFLEGVQRVARAAGALFVVDEVQAARNSYAGEHSHLAEMPDLILLGKLIGGGLPVGAVAGRGELLEHTAADRGSLPHSGTFNGNRATLAAGSASLQALDAEAIIQLNIRAERLAAAIEAAGTAAGIAVSVTRAGSIMHVHLLPEAPTNAAEASGADPEKTTAMHLLLLDAGVYAAPRGMLNLSTAVTGQDLDEVVRAYAGAFNQLASLN